MFRQPVLVFEGDKEVLAARARDARVRRGLPTAVYTADMFATGHDEATGPWSRAVPGDRAGPGRAGRARAAQRRGQGAQGRDAAPLTGQRAVRVCTLSWSPGGVPAQPVPSTGTNSAAVSPGGYTRNPRTGVGRQTAAS